MGLLRSLLAWLRENTVRRDPGGGGERRPPQQQDNGPDEVVAAIRNLSDTISNEARATRDQGKHESDQNRQWTIGAVAGAYVLAAISLLQWCSTERAVEISRRTLDAAQRAQLFSTPSRLYLSDEYLPTVIFTMHNYGKSPAFEIKYGIACEFKPGRPVVTWQYPVEVTAPPDKDTDALKAKCWKTPREFVDGIGDGTREYWLWIGVRYRDLVSATGDRETLECWHHSIGGRQFGPCEPGSNYYR